MQFRPLAEDRQIEASRAAWLDGYNHGEHEGYMAGFRWGSVVWLTLGFAAGILATAAVLHLGLLPGVVA